MVTSTPGQPCEPYSTPVGPLAAPCPLDLRCPRALPFGTNVHLCPHPALPRWVQGDAMAMPFAPASFHSATMGYGLRNVASIPDALAELHRVLKPGEGVGRRKGRRGGERQSRW